MSTVTSDAEAKPERKPFRRLPVKAPNDVVSLDIAAPAKEIYALISDITKMGRWSPETYRTRWLGGASGAEAGARFKGYNRWHWVRWATRVEVQVADPGHEFSFCTIMYGKPRTLWSYTFFAKGGGVTQVIETRTSFSTTFVYGNFQRYAMRGHVESFKDGMLQTLQRLKVAAEAGADPTALSPTAGSA
jgi:uncharacterized protein YndB with AHSA1/START domain